VTDLDWLPRRDLTPRAVSQRKNALLLKKICDEAASERGRVGSIPLDLHVADFIYLGLETLLGTESVCIVQ